MKIIIKGRIPSKKNSRILLHRGSKLISIPSKKYKEWHKEVSWQIQKSIPAEPLKECKIKMDFYMPDNRKTDLDNKAQSVLDLFQDLGIIENDCWQVVKSLSLEAKGIDRKNPRCEISIGC